MIIQRFVIAIRRQDWFQVFVELLIVVVGIFLGLQVDDWNNDREDRVQEGIYLERLHSEVLEALAYREQVFEGVVLSRDIDDFNRSLGEVLAVFDGPDTETILGPEHCFAIMASHIYNDQSVDIPTLRELNASGQLTLIQSEELKLAISQFAFGREGLSSLVGVLGGSALVLARKYPDLIKLDLKMRDIQAKDQFRHQCDFESMQLNTSSTNDLVDNATRMNAFAQTTKTVEAYLNALHIALDNELDISH